VDAEEEDKNEWLTPLRKSLIGKMAKRILDIGRVLNLT